MELTNLLGFIPGPERGMPRAGEKNGESVAQLTVESGALRREIALSRTDPLSISRTPPRESGRMGEGKT
jgi:hypothetical protein